jgi:hypothetical protein
MQASMTSRLPEKEGIMPAANSRDALQAEDTIRAAVIRLCRPDGYGGAVIERAAIVAEGAPAGAIEDWILAHGGEPEVPVVAVRSGLYGLRPDTGHLTRARAPRRYVLPAEALS